MHLEQVLDEVDADERGGAAHAGEVVGEHVTAQLEVVGDHGRHGGGWRKAGARHNDDVNLHRRQLCTVSSCAACMSALTTLYADT